MEVLKGSSNPRVYYLGITFSQLVSLVLALENLAVEDIYHSCPSLRSYHSEQLLLYLLAS